MGIMVLAGSVPSGGCEEDSSKAVCGDLRLVELHPTSTFMFTWRSSWVSVSKFLLFVRKAAILS